MNSSIGTGPSYLFPPPSFPALEPVFFVAVPVGSLAAGLTERHGRRSTV